jgi:hypothetical protein
MKVRIADPKVLSDVRARSLRLYLATRGWQRHERPNSIPVWTTGDGPTEFEVLPPSSDQVPDFDSRMADILGVLSVVENRSELEILRDILQVSFDVQYYRLDHEGPEGTAPLGEASAALKSAQALLLAAASSLEFPGRLVLPNRSAANALDLGRRSLAGPTTEGSYVFSVWVPVPPRLTPEEDLVLFVIDDEPFERVATLRLHEALEALSEAINEVRTADAGLNAFTSRVNRGVNAGVCEAVAGIVGDSRIGVEARFSWAIDRPIRIDPAPIRIDANGRDLLLEAAREMRALEPEEEVLVQGNVVRLHRDTQQGSGDVTIAGLVVGDLDGRLRHVTVSLAESDYQVAIQAHAQGDIVEVIGELMLRGTRAHLRNARSFVSRPTPE